MFDLRPILRAILSFVIPAMLLFMIASQIKAAKIRTLNYFMPSSYAGIDDPAQTSRYLRYYRLVSLLTPMKADAQAMAGFCYGRLGQWPKAEKSYQKALQTNPDLFWAYYNLALVDTRQGQAGQAQNNLKKAVSLDYRQALEHILTNKIYTDIAANNHLTPQMLAAHLAEGYRQASAWLQTGKIEPTAEMNIF